MKTTRHFKIRWKGMAVVLGVVLMTFSSSTTYAATIATLGDNNSTVAVDLDSGAGMYDWTVDGVDQLDIQWFWYRKEGGTCEKRIDTLELEGHDTFDTGLSFLPEYDSRDDTLTASYKYNDGADDIVRVIVKYMLTGGTPGSGTSDLTEVISFHNLTGGQLNFQFFQYTDLSLDGTATDQLVEIHGGNTAQQTGDTIAFSETVVTPMPDRYEAGEYSTTINKLDDLNADDLDDIIKKVCNDLTWAFQWNVEIPVGGAFIISKDKHIEGVPEPSTLALVCVAILFLIGQQVYRRRRR